METKTVPLSDADRIAASRLSASTVKLRVPVELGSEVVEELVIRPTVRAFRGFSLTVTGDGGMVLDLYELARLGVMMAGHPAVLLEKLDVADMREVAQAVAGFLMPGPKAGSA